MVGDLLGAKVALPFAVISLYRGGKLDTLRREAMLRAMNSTREGGIQHSAGDDVHSRRKREERHQFRPQPVQPWINSGIWPKFMLIIS